MVWLIYLIIGVFHIYAIYSGHSEWVSWTKPLLMPVLLLIIWLQTKVQTKLSKVLFIGVFLGWLGDVLLMTHSVGFFAAGLTAFLLGHLSYIYIFSVEVSDKRQTHFIMEKPYWILPFIGFLVYAVILLSGKIINLPAFPVYLYAFVILLMSIMAINRWYAVSQKSFLIVLVGSLLFVLSDFSLAIKLFVGNYPNSSLLIMTTYILAQGAIVYGCLENKLVTGK